jgi:hypothetical protein
MLEHYLIVMDLSRIINLERVELVNEDPDTYIVKYKGMFYEIAKGDESHWAEINASSPPTLKQELKLEQRLIPETGIFQDANTPQEFKEVMMFHELREREYKLTGFEDAHERAINDEILYVLKFFDEQTRQRYLDFATALREKHAKQKPTQEQPTESIAEIFILWKEGEWSHSYDDDQYNFAESLLGTRTFTQQDLDQFAQCLKYQYKKQKGQEASLPRELSHLEDKLRRYYGYWIESNYFDNPGGFDARFVMFLAALLNKTDDETNRTHRPTYLEILLPEDIVKDIKETNISGEFRDGHFKERFSTRIFRYLRRKNIAINACDLNGNKTPLFVSPDFLWLER